MNQSIMRNNIIAVKYYIYMSALYETTHNNDILYNALLWYSLGSIDDSGIFFKVEIYTFFYQHKMILSNSMGFMGWQ